MNSKLLSLSLASIFAFSALAGEFGNWHAVDGYEAVAEHAAILKAAEMWAAENRDAETYQHNYGYSIQETDAGYYVAVELLDHEFESTGIPGGHFGLYINKDGEVYDVFIGA